VHLAEKLWRVDARVSHHQIIRIPDGRACFLREIAILDDGTVDMPPRILSIELTVVSLYALTLLDTRLTVGNDDVLKTQVVCGEQRTLATESLVFNQFHYFNVGFTL
jgi:hypothetical protein